MKIRRRADIPIGTVFGRLTVQYRERGRNKFGQYRWSCMCSCGTPVSVTASALQSGGTRSCGCLREEYYSTHQRHGHGRAARRSATYRSWDHMIQRCTNPSNDNYRYYGGRGINVCPRWRDFSMFLADMGERPFGRSLDRIENDGNYEPGNCRWATAKEQQRNQRRDPKTGKIIPGEA